MKKKLPAYVEHVLKFQLYLLKTRHGELAKQNKEKRDINAYIWHALCAAHKTNGQKREDIVRHMLGDFKRYSLTPQGRKEQNDGEEATQPEAPA